MASTPPTQEAFLREVDEELRRDELQSLWQRYGRLGIAIIVLLLAAWGGWLYWQAEKDKIAEIQGIKERVEELRGEAEQRVYQLLRVDPWLKLALPWERTILAGPPEFTVRWQATQACPSLGATWP